MADLPGGPRAHERRGRRGPGPAVLVVLLYALLFALALWFLRTRSPLFHRRSEVSVSSFEFRGFEATMESPGTLSPEPETS